MADVPLPHPVMNAMLGDDWEDLYTADQMHSHAAAVSAAKDAEIERLRAEVAGLREDAERYRWLRPRLFSADFDYNENGIVALVFEMPPSTQFWADCDMTVDAARKGEA